MLKNNFKNRTVFSDDQMRESGDESAIRQMAFQIHLAYGGSDLDNWLEAEEALRNDDQSAFISTNTRGK